MSLVQVLTKQHDSSACKHVKDDQQNDDYVPKFCNSELCVIYYDCGKLRVFLLERARCNLAPVCLHFMRKYKHAHYRRCMSSPCAHRPTCTHPTDSNPTDKPSRITATVLIFRRPTRSGNLCLGDGRMICVRVKGRERPAQTMGVWAIVYVCAPRNSLISLSMRNALWVGG